MWTWKNLGWKSNLESWKNKSVLLAEQNKSKKALCLTWSVTYNRTLSNIKNTSATLAPVKNRPSIRGHVSTNPNNSISLKLKPNNSISETEVHHGC